MPERENGRRRGRVISIETQLDIGRPATDVFDFVSHQPNAVRWQKGLHEVRRTTPGPLGVGSEHVFVRRFAGLRISSRNRFVEFDPPRFVEFEIPKGSITGRASYLVEPTGEGSSRLTSRMDFTLTWWLRPFRRQLARVLEHDSRRDEQTLKALLESASG